MFCLRCKTNIFNYVLLEHSTTFCCRWLAVGFITVTIILVVQILDRSNLDRPNKLQENTSITAQDHQGPEKRIKLDIETIRAKRINVLAEEGRTFSANRSKGNRY